jgi:uncharacterized protein YukE
MGDVAQDRFIQKIMDCMVEEDYQEAIFQCGVALNAYSAIQQGLKAYKQALAGIRASASSMKGAAAAAEPSLLDQVGSSIVKVISECAGQLAAACADGDDDVDQDMGTIDKKVDFVERVRQRARQLQDEKEKRERDEKQRQQGMRGYER